MTFIERWPLNRGPIQIKLNQFYLLPSNNIWCHDQCEPGFLNAWGFFQFKLCDQPFSRQKSSSSGGLQCVKGSVCELFSKQVMLLYCVKVSYISGNEYSTVYLHFLNMRNLLHRHTVACSVCFNICFWSLLKVSIFQRIATVFLFSDLC